jgi:C1A family cysteine protease
LKRMRRTKPKSAIKRKTVKRPKVRPASYGWIPDLPDHRDFHYVPIAKFLRAPPKRVDLRHQCPRVGNQGKLNSCTAHAIAAAIQFDKLKQAHPESFPPSRLFIYYNERALERTVRSDSGARIRSGIKTVAKRGACHEHLWPYRPNKFQHRPHRKCYTEAAKHPAVSYRRIHRELPQLKACLASGYPFIFGFTVYDSFHTKKVSRSGRAQMPRKHENVRAGHAALAVGYDDGQRRFIVRNSWGTNWGMGGYFTMPYAYFTNRYLSQDFWTIRVVG